MNEFYDVFFIVVYTIAIVSLGFIVYYSDDED